MVTVSGLPFWQHAPRNHCISGYFHSFALSYSIPCTQSELHLVSLLWSPLLPLSCTHLPFAPCCILFFHIARKSIHSTLIKMVNKVRNLHRHHSHLLLQTQELPKKNLHSTVICWQGWHYKCDYPHIPADEYGFLLKDSCKSWTSQRGAYWDG